MLQKFSMGPFPSVVHSTSTTMIGDGKGRIRSRAIRNTRAATKIHPMHPVWMFFLHAVDGKKSGTSCGTLTPIFKVQDKPPKWSRKEHFSMLCEPSEIHRANGTQELRFSLMF